MDGRELLSNLPAEDSENEVDQRDLKYEVKVRRIGGSGYEFLDVNTVSYDHENEWIVLETD